MLTTLAVGNYRSLRDLVLPLSGLTVVTGPNGSGKSSLYRALRLLADASRNGAVAALAREGGLQSTLWAGPETVGRSPVQGTVRTKPVGLRLGFAGDEFGYALDLGLPVPGRTMFNLDPEFKREAVWSGPVLRPAAVLADRAGPSVRTRVASGGWGEDLVTNPAESRRTRTAADSLSGPVSAVTAGRIGNERHSKIRLTDSMLSEFADPRACPELLVVRERIRSWRFYDHFRTDAAAPARQSRPGTRTFVLAADGADLASALQTIIEVGRAADLASVVDAAFPGSRVEVVSQDGVLAVRFHQHGLLRPLSAAELSDGTLRFLLWVAALLTPRPPELLVLNEPETSLHPDLLPALAALIATAAEETQIVVVSHASALIRALSAIAQVGALELEKEHGETRLSGQGLLDRPSWHWPKR